MRDKDIGIKIGDAIYHCRWFTQNTKPKKGGWYYTTNIDGSLASRYYDDSRDSWYIATARYGFTPNHSFNEWLYIKGLHQDNQGEGES